VNEMLGGAVGSASPRLLRSMDRYPDYPALVPDGSFAPTICPSRRLRHGRSPEPLRGVTAKFIYEKIDFESATGWAIDAGSCTGA